MDLEEPVAEELERRRVTNRRLLIVAVVLSACTVLGSFALGYFRFQDVATFKAQQTSIERQDCARKINQRYADLRDERDEAANDSLIQVLAGIGQPPTAFDQAALKANVDRYFTAKKSLHDLGPYDTRVDRNCPQV